MIQFLSSQDSTSRKRFQSGGGGPGLVRFGGSPNELSCFWWLVSSKKGLKYCKITKVKKGEVSFFKTVEKATEAHAGCVFVWEDFIG